MKKLFIVVFVLVLLSSLSVTAFAGNGDIDSYYEEFSYDDMISSVDSSVIDILNEIGITEISYESIFSVTPKKVLDSLYEMFKNGLSEPFKYFLSITGVMALMALITNISRSPETVTLIGSCCVSCFLAVPIVSLITRSFSVLEALSVFTSSFAVVFCAVTSAAGGTIQGTSFLGMNVALNSVMTVMLSSVSKPLCNVMCSLSFLSCFNIKTFSERMSDLIKKAYIFILGALTTVFSGVSGIKAILGSSADTVAIRGVKFLVGRSIPLVGGVVSESYQSVIASLQLIKSTVGVFGIITVIVTVLPIILELIIWCFMLSLISTMGDILGSFKIQNLILIFKDVLILLIATIIFSSVLFIISCGFMLVFKNG
jgi:stage III sporulation protein AE